MQPDDRENPLSVARKWLAWCIGLIVVMTVGWTAFVAWYEVSTGNHENLAEATIAVAARTATVSPTVVIYAILVTLLMDVVEGSVVVTKRYLTNKFVKPLIERHKAQGRQEGLREGRQEGRQQGRQEGRQQGRKEGRREAFEAFYEWNRRRLEAEKNGQPFDESLPTDWDSPA